MDHLLDHAVVSMPIKRYVYDRLGVDNSGEKEHNSSSQHGDLRTFMSIPGGLGLIDYSVRKNASCSADVEHLVWTSSIELIH